MELASLISRHSRYRPHEQALVFGDRSATWQAFDRRVGQLAGALLDLGVKRGDRVATVLSNCAELLELYWAVPRIGAVLVPLSPLLMPAGLASLLRDSGAKVLFSSPASRAAVAAALAGSPELASERVVPVGETGAQSFEARLERSRYTAHDACVGADDPFNIMYTSGTTGLPKGIVHTHRIRAMYATLFASAWRMTPESVVLHSGAIVFNGAFVTLMPCFWLGARYVLMPQFDAESMIATIERERATHVMVVPAQVAAMLDSPGFSPQRLASLEMILSLGAPLAQARKDELNRLLPGRFHELYGLTEGFVTILDRTQTEHKSGSVGVPMSFNEMRIVDEAGSDLPPREVGEIVGRGPLLMTGYYNRPDLTAQAIRGGWLHTGDMGYADEDGYLYLVDRKKDMIDSGGVKVYPRDIEEVAARHPFVREVAVFGVPHEKWGETPVAAVVLKAAGAVGADELRDWINERVGARYQRVQQVLVLPDFPRNAAGKTLKRELREPFWAGRAAMI